MFRLGICYCVCVALNDYRHLPRCLTPPTPHVIIHHVNSITQTAHHPSIHLPESIQLLTGKLLGNSVTTGQWMSSSSRVLFIFI